MGDVTYTVTEVHPSQARNHEALVWLSLPGKPYVMSYVWDRQRLGEFPEVGATVRL